MSKKVFGVLAAGAAVAGAAYAANKYVKVQQEKDRQEAEEEIKNRNYGDRQVYFVGGGLASLAGAGVSHPGRGL